MRVSITWFRRNLGRVVNEVKTGGDYCVVVSHGEPVGAFVSMDDLQLIWLGADEMEQGPADVETGRRPGRRLWRKMRVALAEFGTYATEEESEAEEEERRAEPALRAFLRKAEKSYGTWKRPTIAQHLGEP